MVEVGQQPSFNKLQTKPSIFATYSTSVQGNNKTGQNPMSIDSAETDMNSISRRPAVINWECVQWLETDSIILRWRRLPPSHMPREQASRRTGTSSWSRRRHASTRQTSQDPSWVTRKESGVWRSISHELLTPNAPQTLTGLGLTQLASGRYLYCTVYVSGMAWHGLTDCYTDTSDEKSPLETVICDVTRL